MCVCKYYCGKYGTEYSKEFFLCPPVIIAHILSTVQVVRRKKLVDKDSEISGWFLPHTISVPNYYYTHTTILLLFWDMSGTTRVSRYQKGKTKKVKTNLDLLEQEIVSGSGICWAICKSAPHPRQPHQHPTAQFFTGWMPFLPPNQQRHSTSALKLLVQWHEGHLIC